jgi:hypothetical protein
MRLQTDPINAVKPKLIAIDRPIELILLISDVIIVSNLEIIKRTPKSYCKGQRYTSQSN